MEANRTEALDLLRKWFSERALLRCDLGFSDFAACLRGRIMAVSDERLHILSDDTFTELELPLRASFAFGYGEPRDFPDEAAEFESTLVIFLTFPLPTREPDTISLLKVKNG